jgi:hypothetical protein
MKEKLSDELKFCLELWQKQGHCTFGGRTDCEQCAVPYLLYKLITGNVLHGDMDRLTLDDWEKLAEKTTKGL